MSRRDSAMAVILYNDQYLVLNSLAYSILRTRIERAGSWTSWKPIMTCWSSREESFRGVKVAISTRSESEGDFDRGKVGLG